MLTKQYQDLVTKNLDFFFCFTHLTDQMTFINTVNKMHCVSTGQKNDHIIEVAIRRVSL